MWAIFKPYLDNDITKNLYFYNSISICSHLSQKRVKTYMFRNLAIILFLTFILVISLGSCKREIYEFPATDTAYFPIDSGTYAIYRVKYVLYNDFESRVDTFNYLLKEQIGESETDNLGKPYRRIERYILEDSSSSWQFRQVWAAQVQDNFAYRIEDNQRFVAISFPLFKGKEWDGLVYIRKDTTISIPGGTIDMYKDWNSFSVLSLDIPETIAGISYDSVLTIKRVDKINNIERRYSFEKYAKNIGLISRQDSILDTQCGGNIASCINTPWSQKAEKGFILDMQLIESNR